MNKIYVENLNKIFLSGEEEIELFNIEKINFDSNATYSIIGESGSGKSTFLQILAGLDLPTKGDVILKGDLCFKYQKDGFININKLKEKVKNKVRRSDFGFIYQRNFLINDLSILDNLLIVKNDKEKGLELLDKVGLLNKKDKLPYQLSGGEKQRISICRALMNEPSFIFADEPTGSLDPQNKEKIWDLFLSFQRKHKFGLIMVTHDIELAKKTDVIYELKNKSLKLVSNKKTS